MLIDFLERGESREGEKHWSVASLMHPKQGLNPQPRYVPWQGIEPMNFWFIRQHYNELSPTQPGRKMYLNML